MSTAIEMSGVSPVPVTDEHEEAPVPHDTPAEPTSALGSFAKAVSSAMSFRPRASSHAPAVQRARQPSFSPILPDNAPVIITFENLKVVQTKNREKELLKGITGSITGGMWAIMGGSGGGKTTLLSALSLRLDPKFMETTGLFKINGRDYDRNLLKSISAYVLQDDVMLAELTVAETLYYASELRLPSTMTSEERADRVQEVLALMEISHIQNVIIGDSRRKGVSGGERKRVSIAVELLNRPKLLFLDEPTSGLDSTTAFTVCNILKKLTQSGECTIICTIHQPQAKLFELFDNLILMKRGAMVYLGARAKSVAFLEQVGAPLGEGVNLADALLEAIAPTAGAAAEEYVRREVPVNLSLGFDLGGFEYRSYRNWLVQFIVLCKRNWKQAMRRKDIIFINFIATIVLAIFIGLGIWHNIGTTQSSVATRVPALFFTSVSQGVLASLQTINSFPAERPVMLRERAAGTYKVSAYYLSKTAVDMFVQLIGPVVFSALVYPLIGFREGGKHFFTYLAFMILDTYAATALATAVSTICVSIELSTVVLSVVFEISRLYGGFFTSPAQLHDSPQWGFADGLSYIKYAFVGVALNELTDLPLSCTTAQIAATTCVSNGNAIIVQRAYDDYTIGQCAGILLFYIVGMRFLGYLGLRYIKN